MARSKTPAPAKNMHEFYVGKERDRLAALRTKDPDKNLAARWKLVQARQPGLAERRLGYVPVVIEHRWAVIAIPEEGFAYTIGLRYRFGQPELLIAAPHLELEEQKRILNAIGMYVSLGNRIEAGEPVDLEDFGLSITFKPYSHEVFEKKYATGYLATFERFFEDIEHTTGDTLPVLWAEIAKAKRGAKKSGAKKSGAKKSGAKKSGAKKSGRKTRR